MFAKHFGKNRARNRIDDQSGPSDMKRPFIHRERGFGRDATFIEMARWRSSIRSHRTPSPPD
jgi:hypothetical protein